MDGTVSLGDKPMKGAASFFSLLNERGVEYFFLSNNCSKGKAEYVERLVRMRIDCSQEQVILPTEGLLKWLHSNDINDVFVLGNSSFCSTLQEHGVNTASETPQLVIAAFDTELTYDKLRQACIFIQQGVEYVATNIDMVCPTEKGFIPDTGAICQLLESATGKKPKKIFGKPYRHMIEPYLEGVSSSDVVIIGDRLYTDMQLAKNVNCDFILVLSGETKFDDLHKIDYDKWMFVNEIGELVFSTHNSTQHENV